MEHYEKAVLVRQAGYAANKLKVFEPLLAEMLSGAEITTNQIAAMYNLHRSTARSYREQLVKAGAIRLNRQINMNNVAYEGAYVINDIEKARAFLDHLRSGQNISRTQSAAVNKPSLLPGTHIHCAKDDAEVPTRRMCNEQVEVKRHWLDIALFGDGPAPSLSMEAA